MPEAIEQRVPVRCGCGSAQCRRSLVLPVRECTEIADASLCVIVDDCDTPPRPDEEFVAKREGYSITRVVHGKNRDV